VLRLSSGGEGRVTGGKGRRERKREKERKQNQS
jgi:hypothetical protein